MSLIATVINLDEWPCGCWQIEGHSVLHLCANHQVDGGDGSYWRTHETVKKQGRLLEVDPARLEPQEPYPDAAPHAEEGWQPIATAPREQRILVYSDDPDDIGIMWGYQLPDGSWTEDETGCGIKEPTHWMSLPAPPLTGSAGPERK